MRVCKQARVRGKDGRSALKRRRHSLLAIILMSIGTAFVAAKEYVVVTGHPIHDDCTLLVIRVYDDAGTPKDRSDDILIATGYELIGECRAFQRENSPSIPTPETSSLKLFPNPNDGKFQVDLGNASYRKVFVINIATQQKIDLEPPVSTGVQSFDLSYLPEGHYIFFAVGENIVRSAKFQIVKK